MSKRLSILLLLLSALSVAAQSVRLTPYRNPSALYLDFDRLYNYNRYERSRIELCATWVTPSETAGRQDMFLGQWTLKGYAAYSFGDKALKYGGQARLLLPGRYKVQLGLGAYNDLERAALRSMEGYKMLSPDYNTGFLASRYIGVKGGKMDVSFRMAYGWSLTAGALLHWEDYRFDGQGTMVYPRQRPDAAQPVLRHEALTACAKWDGGVTLSLAAGRMVPTASDGPARNYLRALAQYSAEPGDWGLHVFAQTGFSTEGTPYSRMFDVSGTARSVYFFRNTFLTVRPYTFTANMFAHLCLNYTAPLPLWENSWSQPQPFLQLNAMWGRLHGQDGNGQAVLEDPGLAEGDLLYLQAPHMGLAEVATGFDGLLRWGLFDLGFGVAYQLCPLKAPYFNENPTENFALALVATFILDKKPSNRNIISPEHQPNSEQYFNQQ